MSLVSMASVSATPLVISGTALMPPVPVLAMTPGPSRLNQVSSVNDCAPSAGAAPNVTRLLEPLKRSAVFTETLLTVMVTLALVLAPASSFAVSLSTYEPAAENVAVVVSVFALENVTYAPALNAAPFAGGDGTDSSRTTLVAFVNGQTGAGNPQRQGLNSALLDGLDRPAKSALNPPFPRNRHPGEGRDPLFRQLAS